MIIEKIKFTAHFENGIMVAKWIGIEGISDPGETPDQTFQLIQDQVAKWHQQSNPENLAPGQQGPPGELPTINRADERLIEFIQEAESKQILSKYAKAATSAATQSAYAKRFKELSND